MKEKSFLIDITDKNLESLIKEAAIFAVNSYLEANPNLNLSLAIKTDRLENVFFEVLNDDYSNVKNKEMLYDILEKIYDHWRSIKRYILIRQNRLSSEKEDNFLAQFDSINEALLKKYRKLCYKLTGKHFSVYRQLSAYADAALMIDDYNEHIYKGLKNAHFISKMAFRTPFISYSASNKRTGFFQATNINPLNGINIKSNEWFVIPVLCGQLKIHVYFSKRYISLGVALSGLFQFNDDYKTTKPDGIIIFGSNTTNGIYYDKEKDLYIASLVESDEIDYFGYIKKIILTVHNFITINDNKLPIHGAGLSITLKNGKIKNVVIIGDSGAGKSETIEALQRIEKNEILDIVTIYDDMGLFEIIDNQIYTSGTEIGAFVRTDDLSNDFIYKVFDRAFFLNPNCKNARLVLPITSYKNVIKKYRVDYVLYANNYEKKEKKIALFNNVDDAITLFQQGKRMALGTTEEEGLTSTFFANPFGPVQFEKKTKTLIHIYFDILFKRKVSVGQLFTGLGLENGKDNPKLAAKELYQKILVD